LVIALTGWGQEDDRRKSREAGFDYHLTKPVDLGQLQTLLVPAEVAVERLEVSRSSDE
jgi:CheY-like chemotaxis protein